LIFLRLSSTASISKGGRIIMTKQEIIQCVVNNHNRLAHITVSGDSAILMGDTLKDLRALVQQLQVDLEAEEAANFENEKKAQDSEK